MPTITTKSASQIRQSWIGAAQASAARIGRILDFTVGSVNLAIADGAITIGLWLQKVALQVLGMTRFATSEDADADSWGAQFQFDRLLAVAATGSVTFTRTNTTARAVVPVGTVVQTTAGTQKFDVYVDTTNGAYSVADNGYVMAIGIATVSVPVQAETAGVAGNVQAGTVTVIVGSLASVNSLTNAAAFLNGLDKETDTAYRARFPKYLAGLARANRSAIEAAIEATQQGIQYGILENTDLVSSVLTDAPGYVLVVIDDGSGSPPEALLDRVFDAIAQVRGLSIKFRVIAPTVVTANIALTITMRAGYDHTAAMGLAQTAIQNFLNTRPLGTLILPRTRLAQVIYDSVAGVAAVLDTITINTLAADLTLTKVQVVKSGSVTVS